MPVRPQRSDLAIAVGRRLRELREGRGISVSELARRAAIGKGTLSELETGQRNPTIETLFALTTALEVPISAVLHDAGGSPEEKASISGDAIDAELVARLADAGSTSELYRIRVRAGCRQASEPHSAGVTEHWIVYAGTVLMGPEDELIRVGPGDSATFAGDVPHSYEVEGDEDVAAALLVHYPS
jgi:transcriptional regulator with XRE-family HTH domain